MSAQAPSVYEIRDSGGRLYIGSTVDAKARWAQHRRALKSNRHHSHKLQAAWNELGASAFSFRIIELLTSISDLRVREQWYLDTLHPVFNVSLSAFYSESNPERAANYQVLGHDDLIAESASQWRVLRLLRMLELLVECYRVESASPDLIELRKYADSARLRDRDFTKIVNADWYPALYKQSYAFIKRLNGDRMSQIKPYEAKRQEMLNRHAREIAELESACPFAIVRANVVSEDFAAPGEALAHLK